MNIPDDGTNFSVVNIYRETLTGRLRSTRDCSFINETLIKKLSALP